TGGAVPALVRTAPASDRLRRVRPADAADFPHRQLLLLQLAHCGALRPAAGRRVPFAIAACLSGCVRENAAAFSSRTRSAAAGGRPIRAGLLFRRALLTAHEPTRSSSGGGEPPCCRA